MRNPFQYILKEGWASCLVVLLLFATVVPVLADECADAKRALAIAEADYDVKKKIWDEATKKVNEVFPKETNALQVYKDAWSAKEKAWANVKKAQAEMQKSWGENPLLRKVPFTSSYNAWNAAVNKVKKALADYKAASKASDKAYNAYKAAKAASEKALADYYKAAADVNNQNKIIRSARKRVEEACGPTELKKLLEGAKTGKVTVAPGRKGNTDKGVEGDAKYREEHGLDRKITNPEDDSEYRRLIGEDKTAPGGNDKTDKGTDDDSKYRRKHGLDRKITGSDDDSAYRKLIGEDKDDSETNPRAEEKNNFDDDDDDYGPDDSLEKLFDDFGMGDGPGVIKEFTRRARDANAEDLAIDAREGGGKGVGSTNATFTAQCDVSAGVGTNTLSANGSAFCSTSGLAGGTANITCVPGSTVTLSAVCTATTCRAFVNSFANLTCPFTAPGFITGGFGGAGGFGTNASVNCTCQ